MTLVIAGSRGGGDMVGRDLRKDYDVNLLFSQITIIESPTDALSMVADRMVARLSAKKKRDWLAASQDNGDWSDRIDYCFIDGIGAPKYNEQWSVNYEL